MSNQIPNKNNYSNNNLYTYFNFNFDFKVRDLKVCLGCSRTGLDLCLVNFLFVLLLKFSLYRKRPCVVICEN